MSTTGQPKAPRDPAPSGLWPGSSPELIAAHERALALVAEEDGMVGGDGRPVTCIAVFLVVLTLACMGVATLFDALPGARLEEDSVARRKFEYFAEYKDSFDTVFVGSSQVYRHVDPLLFDKLLERAGHPVHSFNFGIGGMYMPEVVYTVGWILEQRPANLKWMLVELRDLEPHLFEHNMFSLREISWHTPEVARFMSAVAWSTDDPLLERVDLVHWTLRRMLYRLGNVSLAVPTIETLLTGPAEQPPWPGRGYLAIDREFRANPDDPALRRRRQWFLDNPQVHADLMQQYEDDPRDAEPSALMIDTLAGLTAAIRDAGVEPIFFLNAPNYLRYADIKRAHEMGVIPTLFTNGDADEHPEFYARDQLFELRHLKSPGAQRFTRLMAKDFAEYLDQRQDP